MMTSHWFRDPAVLGSAALALAVAGGVVAYSRLRKKETPEELEQRRRAYLIESGRIIDGTVLDMTDVVIDGPAGSDSGGHMQRHIFYQYAIAGVLYECSQDVTLLAQHLAGATSTPGMPTSVRYAPHNPTNSMVVAENWTGLHHGNPLGFLRPSSAPGGRAMFRQSPEPQNGQPHTDHTLKLEDQRDAQATAR